MLYIRSNIALLALTLLSTSILADDQLAGRRLAVVVGVDKYRVSGGLGDLSHAGADATSVSEALRTAGFTVIEMTHRAAREPGSEHLAPNRTYIRDIISGILETPNLGRDDTVLISLHGHGVHYDEIIDTGETVPRFYFCPADADIRGVQTAKDITDRNSLISTDELYESLGNCRAATRLLIVDACRNDPNRTDVLRSAPLASKTMPKLPPPPGGIAAFFSCKANQVSVEDKDLGHGVFSHFLVRGLAGRADQALEGGPADGVITMSELTTYVANNTYAHVLRKYKGRYRQSPDIRGEFDTNLPLTRIAERPGPGNKMQGKSSPAKMGRPNLHILAIATNDYAASDIPPLGFAEADARRVASAFEHQCVGAFEKIEVNLLLGKEASQSGILNALERLSQRVGKHDVCLVFYAGTGRKEGETLFLLPHDGKLERLSATGVSSVDMAAKLETVQGRLLFLVDSCYSGSLTDNDFATGTILMTATDRNSLAFESSSLGGGYFSLALTEGLTGKADTNNDGVIDTDELASYVTTEVTRNTTESLTGTQRPVTKTFGQMAPLPLTQE